MPVDLSKVGLEGIESFYAQQQMAAQARKLDSATQDEQFDLEQKQRFQELSDQASQHLNDIAKRKKQTGFETPDEVDSLADPLEAVADIYLRGGAPTQGAEFLSKASEIRKREDEMQSAEVTRRQNRLENILKGADIVGRKLGGAQNQSEWDQGLREVEEAGIVEPHLMEQLKQFKEFNPDLAAYFSSQAISAAQKAQMDLTANSQEATERYRLSQLAQGRTRIELQRARDKDTRNYRERLLKAGGKTAPSASAPNGDELKSVKRALKSSVFRDIDTDTDDVDFNSAADFIAGRAKALVRDNKALTWDTAVQQAIILGQQSGVITVKPGTSGFFGFGSKPADAVVDRQNGKTIDTPMPMPANKDQMIKGRYYITAKGRAKWTGTAFELVDK